MRRRTLLAVSGSSTPPVVLVGGASFSTSTLSSSGTKRLAAIARPRCHRWALKSTPRLALQSLAGLQPILSERSAPSAQAQRRPVQPWPYVKP